MNKRGEFLRMIKQAQRVYVQPRFGSTFEGWLQISKQEARWMVDKVQDDDDTRATLDSVGTLRFL